MTLPRKAKGILLISAALLLLLLVSAEESHDTDINVDVVDSCGAGIHDLSSPGYRDTGVIGVNDTDYFSGTLSNSGNQEVELFFNLSIYPRYDPTLHPDVNDSDGEKKPMPLDSQPGNYTFETTLDSETQSVNNTRFKNFLVEFWATEPFEPGNYTGEAVVDFACNTSVQEDSKGNVSDETHFEIIDIEGEGVLPDDVGEDDEVDQQVDTDAETEDLNETAEVDTDTNETEDVEEGIDPDVDQDIEDQMADSEPVEGDSDEPGETEVPEPEPEPEPDPDPRLKIEIDPVNRSYDAIQGQFAPANLEVESFAEETVEDINLNPLIDETDPDWGVETADIASIEPNETVEREVFVQPPEDAEPGEHTIPVVAEDDELIMDIDYFTVDVEEAEFTPFLEIVEAPTDINIEVEDEFSAPILIENIGRTNLTNVEARLDNIDSCASANVTGTDFMDINDTASLTMNIEADDSPEDCETTLVVNSEDGAYAFASIDITIVPEEGLLPREHEVPFTAISWTFLLVGYAVMRKKYDLNSAVVNVPFLILILGQTFIILYMVAAYYGIVSLAFLPF